MSANYEITHWQAPSMGGRLAVAVAADTTDAAHASRAVELVGRRVDAWAKRLTRFDDQSDLARLNAVPATTQRVRPTLGAVLAWARQAEAAGAGVLDVTLLDARLAAEAGAAGDDGGGPSHGRRADSARWTIDCLGRGARVVRPAGVRFDLDGVAKGWLADRASELLARWPGGYVDADGDIALAAAGEIEWLVDVVDPRDTDGAPLATLRFAGGGWRRTCGVATSGTSVHRWPASGQPLRHHLIDPRTGQPAQTDVVQATVVAPTAGEGGGDRGREAKPGVVDALRRARCPSTHRIRRVADDSRNGRVAVMKYRGLSRRTRLIRWGLLLVLVAIVLAGTAGDAVAGLMQWLGTDSAALPWYGTRLFGFLAYGALTASVLYGLLLSTGILDSIAHRAVSFTLHQELAALALSLTAIHGALLALDTTVPTSVWAIVVPFAGAYRPLWVGIGQAAFWLSVAVYASFSARRFIGQRRWRLVHYATFLGFVGATVHGLMAGSDTQSSWALTLYAVSAGAVALLMAYRLAGAAWTRIARRPARVPVSIEEVIR